MKGVTVLYRTGSTVEFLHIPCTLHGDPLLPGQPVGVTLRGPDHPKSATEPLQGESGEIAGSRLKVPRGEPASTDESLSMEFESPQAPKSFTRYWEWAGRPRRAAPQSTVVDEGEAS